MGQLALSEQDMKLLLALHDFTYLDKSYIKKYVFNHYNHEVSIHNRLTRLRQNDYITGFAVQIDRKSQKTEHIYTLGKTGADVLEAEKGVIHWKPSWATSLRPIWRHQIAIANVVKQYELQAETVGLEVKEFIPEPRAFYRFDGSETGKKFNVIRPDGILVVGKKGEDVNIGIMLEMERSYSDREHTLQKTIQYNRFFNGIEIHGEEYDRHVAFNHPIADWRVLFIGDTEAKTKTLIRHLKESKPDVRTLVAMKEEIVQTPFAAIYQDVNKPGELRGL